MNTEKQELINKLLEKSCYESYPVLFVSTIELNENELFFEYDLPDWEDAIYSRWVEDEWDYIPLVVELLENGKYRVLDGYHRYVYLKGKVEKFRVYLVKRGN